jgi:hypothetical protein
MRSRRTSHRLFGYPSTPFTVRMIYGPWFGKKCGVVQSGVHVPERGDIDAAQGDNLWKDR